jgi:hypothetical protein
MGALCAAARVHCWCPARLVRDQDAGHQDIIDVTPAEKELRSQHSLDEEATRLIQAASPDIAAQDPQRQLAGPPAAGLLDAGLYQPPARPAALAGGIDGQPLQLQDMGMRGERNCLPDQGVADNHAVDFGEQRAGGPGPRAKEGRIRRRWRRRRNVFRPRRCLYRSQDRLILQSCLPNLDHHTRMTHRCAPRLMPGS